MALPSEQEIKKSAYHQAESQYKEMLAKKNSTYGTHTQVDASFWLLYQFVAYKIVEILTKRRKYSKVWQDERT